MRRKLLLLCCLFVFCVIVGWFGRGYNDDRVTDSNDASVTIQQVERDNQSARNDIGDAAAQIDDAKSALVSGQADIAAATGRVDELQERADADAAVLDECKGIIDACRIQLEEAKRIFADVDRENKLDE